MPIGSSKQAAVPTTPSSFNSPKSPSTSAKAMPPAPDLVHESMTLTVHQTCTLEPSPFSLRPACKALTSLRKAQTKRGV
jgi:hypothetical protein